MNQIMELKFTSKSLQRQAQKCEKDDKSKKLRVKNDIEKGNMDSAKMTTINKSISSIVKSLESSLNTGNLQKMPGTMDLFECQFVNMEVQAEFMESSMAGSTSLSTLEDQVGSLMQSVADDYGLEVSVGLPQVVGHVISSKNEENVTEDDLSRHFAELMAHG
ncbi:hypothetical protein R3W88_022874 [Solanum pinnatisectum]|uniref:Uncharacterized protein n=1 Tax=Solanum pinnatisectum TaxID=50273 RepID=A0AAV9LVY5_9SOLN|nr:hypothetical protein R3W88_022874 [Solanum pinnatisectum]